MSDSTSCETSDRRIKDRYTATCLKVELQERGFFGRGKNSTAVTCLDMNRYGMAVLCPRPVEPGARLFLSFDGKYIRESRVAARVVTCQPFQTGYRVSIQFSYCFERKGYSRTVDNALSRIEGFYNRYAG
ncbi:PilZ domain-containing protein [Marinobacter sp. CHS3-4]|uniref:PilZ domain-containing protein n=1 Tax=Marinobacter sp. CHS3-4 TaxID=3045174 RepID=UPI0024B6288C|nr:PilZ domain-containing protein [Marinobacter sp. CHS3-4]MDI9245995.1 PilZ domain-containing protein [Marinobacter sp. CHS3-4]